MLGRGGGSNSPNTQHQLIYIMHFVYPTQLKWGRGDSKKVRKSRFLFYIRSVNYMKVGASFSGATKETKPLI
jgi:hypothetical protein